MLNFLAKIDQFGSEQKLQIHPTNPIQKSAFGGIMTVILYGLSLAYFLTEFIDWTQNNKLPKITSYRGAIDQAESVKQEGRVFEIFYYQWDDSDVDPFDPLNLTFYPVVTKIVDEMQNQTIIPILFEQTKTTNGKIKNTFFLENLEFIGSPPNNQDITTSLFTDYQIAISMCNQSQIPVGFQCAGEERNQKFFSQVTYFSLVNYIHSFDSKEKNLMKIQKYDQMRVNQNSAEFYYITLQMSNTQTDDGILFNSFRQFKYIKDFAVTSYKMDQNESNKTYGSAPLIVYITLDQIKENVILEYPKISEILADTGSIISWILQISLIAFKYNDNICTNNKIKDIIRLYYPDFDHLNIQQNMSGKFTQVTLKEKKYDPQKVRKIIEQLRTIALKKANYINVQHEISKLQFAIQQGLGVRFFNQNIGKIETLMDNLGCRIDECGADNSQFQQSKLFLSQNIDGNNLQFEMMEYSIDFLRLKEVEASYQPKQEQVEMQIFPSQS